MIGQAGLTLPQDNTSASSSLKYPFRRILVPQLITCLLLRVPSEKLLLWRSQKTKRDAPGSHISRLALLGRTYRQLSFRLFVIAT